MSERANKQRRASSGTEAVQGLGVMSDQHEPKTAPLAPVATNNAPTRTKAPSACPVTLLALEHALRLAADDPKRCHHRPGLQDYRNAERDLGRDMTGDEHYRFGRVFASEYRRLTSWGTQ